MLHLGWLFKTYLRTLAALGRAFGGQHAEAAHAAADASQPHDATAAALAADSFEQVDRAATTAGDHYRALGISVGLLGIAVVFLALAPFGLALDERTAHLVGGLEIALMVTMLLVVVVGRRRRTHRRWIILRARAEELRYRPLAELVERAAAAPDDAPTLDGLEQAMLDILDGPQGQIAYTAAKASQYEAVEHCSDVLLWASVALALVGAVGHLFVHWPGWLFLTAFGPAAMGGLHGINGFLNVGGLIEGHRDMEAALSHSLSELRQLRGSPERGQALPALGAHVLGTLTSHHANWEKSAVKRNLNPA
jgi:hypothetical protein